MNDNPMMIMIVNMTIVFAVLILLWGIISLTGKIATSIDKKNNEESL